MAKNVKTTVVLKYRPKQRLVTKHFKTFKAAFDFASKKQLSEFEIDSIRYFNI